MKISKTMDRSIIISWRFYLKEMFFFFLKNQYAKQKKGFLKDDQ